MRRRLDGPHCNYAVDKKNGVDGVKKYLISILVESEEDPKTLVHAMKIALGTHVIPCKVLSVEKEKKGVGK